jgi:hypothetical protein
MASLQPALNESPGAPPLRLFRLFGIQFTANWSWLLLLGRCLMRLGQTGEANVHYTNARRLFQENGNALWARMAELGIASALMMSPWSAGDTSTPRAGTH